MEELTQETFLRAMKTVEQYKMHFRILFDDDVLYGRQGEGKSRT